MRRWREGSCEQRTTCGHNVHKLGGKNNVGYLADKKWERQKKVQLPFYMR